MQLSTAIKMAQIIEARGRTTARALVEEFGLSTRTVYRYTNELSLCYPIYTAPGSGGSLIWLKGDPRT